MKYLRVTMPNGSIWQVPAAVIAEDRAKYYAEEEGYQAGKDAFRTAMKCGYDLTDWAENNMNWKDVSKHATKVSGCSCQMTEDDFQEGWVNGEKSIAVI